MDALPEGALLLMLSYAAPIQYVSDAPMAWQPGLSAIAVVCKAWRALSQRLAVQQVIFCAQSDTKVASFSDWLQHHAPQLSGVSLYNPWQLRGPSSNRPLAALAAAATSSAAAGRPLRLRRLVLDVAQPKGGTAHEVVGQLLGAVPSLRHLHLRLLAAPPHSHNTQIIATNPWNSDTLSAMFDPLRRLTRLTSFVLDGPYLEAELQHHREQQIPVEPWVGGLCAALPSSLLDMEWVTWHLGGSEGCVLRLPLQLDHLTALTRLAITVNTNHTKVVLPESVFEPLGALQLLQLTGMLPLLSSAPLQAQGLVQWGPGLCELVCGREPRPAVEVLANMGERLPALRTLDLTRVGTCGLDAMEALGSNATQLTRLQVSTSVEDRSLGGYDSEEESSDSEEGGYEFCSAVTYTSLTGLRCLGLDMRLKGNAPLPVLSNLPHLSHLEVHMLGAFNGGHYDDPPPTPGLWPAALVPLTQLQVLSISTLLLATEEPWLLGLSRLVMLQLLPSHNRYELQLPDEQRAKVVQHVRQAALAPGSALQLVLVTPRFHREHDLRAELREGGWPSQVAVLVGTLSWLAAAGQEAWPPGLWRVLEGPVVPTGAAHFWYL